MIRIAVVVSRFNNEVTEGLFQGALEVFKEQGVIFDPKTDRYDAPGAFELPLLAQQLIQKKNYDGVVALGCVIKGETAHFEFISLGAAVGIQMASLQSHKPISFGVLTTYTEEQAVIRSRPGPQNKGREAALACLESIRLLKTF
jgi:6,7-dimethyl-8-ribityllumazine synthase